MMNEGRVRVCGHAQVAGVGCIRVKESSPITGLSLDNV